MRMRRIATTLFLTTAAALLLTTAVASAKAKVVIPARYKVTFAGSGSWSYRDAATDGGSTTTASSTFTWMSVFPSLLVAKVAGSASNRKLSKYGGAWQDALTGPNVETPCTGNGTFATTSAVPAGITMTRSGSKYRIAIDGLPGGQLAQSNPAVDDCGNIGAGLATHDFWHDWMIGSGHLGSVDPDIIGTPVVAHFSIPASKFTKKTFTLTAVPGLGDGVPSNCDNSGGTCGETYSWVGKVTFTRLK